MTSGGRTSWGVAWVLALAGVLTLAVLVALRTPALAPLPPTVDLGPTTIAVLDTIPLAGRTVRAQIDGVVETADPSERRVWLADRGGTLEVALGPGGEALDVGTEQRLVVSGRLRGAGGRRWLHAESWTLVSGRMVAPHTDSVRYGPPPDRSEAPEDRSAGLR